FGDLLGLEDQVLSNKQTPRSDYYAQMADPIKGKPYFWCVTYNKSVGRLPISLTISHLIVLWICIKFVLNKFYPDGQLHLYP
ncbi:hypothetical protein CVH13_00155, partial [Dehalococcoides mccartyi]